MKVALSGPAEDDLRDIARWIAADSPDAARAFSRILRHKCTGLSRSPKRFPVVRTIDGREIRKRTHGRYLVFYAVLGDRVQVLRIIHGSRDWAAVFDAHG